MNAFNRYSVNAANDERGILKDKTSEKRTARARLSNLVNRTEFICE